MINEKRTTLVEKSIQELEKTIIALIFYLESGKMLVVVWQTKMIKICSEGTEAKLRPV